MTAEPAKAAALKPLATKNARSTKIRSASNQEIKRLGLTPWVTRLIWDRLYRCPV